MLVQRAFRYRLSPNAAQRSALAAQFGHARYVYNWALATRRAHYREQGEGIRFFELKRMLTQLKRDPTHEWLNQADSQALQAKIEDLDRAYTNFFEGRARHPKPKKRKHVQSIRYPQRFKFDTDHIYLPKVGWVKATFHRPFLHGAAKRVTVSKTKSGAYYASVQCQAEVEPPANTHPPIGIDLGIKHFAVLSTGEKVAHPQYLRHAERKLARLQRQLTRKRKGSQNREKARSRAARQFEYVARQRSDFLHKLSHRIATTHSVIRLEDLNIVGMVKNHALAKSISDSGWGIFGRLCEYKALWNGGRVERIGRFYPSSKACSACGVLNADLDLRDREWACVRCGAFHDRDYNAALNMLSAPTAGAAERQRLGRMCKTSRFPSRAQRSLIQEAHGFTHG